MMSSPCGKSRQGQDGECPGCFYIEMCNSFLVESCDLCGENGYPDDLPSSINSLMWLKNPLTGSMAWQHGHCNHVCVEKVTWIS